MGNLQYLAMFMFLVFLPTGRCEPFYVNGLNVRYWGCRSFMTRSETTNTQSPRLNILDQVYAQDIAFSNLKLRESLTSFKNTVYSSCHCVSSSHISVYKPTPHPAGGCDAGY